MLPVVSAIFSVVVDCWFSFSGIVFSGLVVLNNGGISGLWEDMIRLSRVVVEVLTVTGKGLVEDVVPGVRSAVLY